MNQKTAKLLRKVSELFNWSYKQLKRHWNKLDHYSRNKARKEYRDLMK